MEHPPLEAFILKAFAWIIKLLCVHY